MVTIGSGASGFNSSNTGFRYEFDLTFYLADTQLIFNKKVLTTFIIILMHEVNQTF